MFGKILNKAKETAKKSVQATKNVAKKTGNAVSGATKKVTKLNPFKK